MSTDIIIEVTDRDGINHEIKGPNLKVINNAGIVEIHDRSGLIALFTGPSALLIRDDDNE